MPASPGAACVQPLQVTLLGGANFPLIAGELLIAARVFTGCFGFAQFSRFKLAIDLLRGRYTDPNSREPGETSHFQALAAALSGTVGLGNIVSVGAACRRWARCWRSSSTA